LGELPWPKPPRLLDPVRQLLRVRHYSPRTEDCYAQWVKRFVLFHGKRHPREMGAAEAEAFLTHLATEGHVAASTQNQAFNALVFLYGQVPETDAGLTSPLDLLDGLTDDDVRAAVEANRAQLCAV